MSRNNAYKMPCPLLYRSLLKRKCGKPALTFVPSPSNGNEIFLYSTLLGTSILHSTFHALRRASKIFTRTIVRPKLYDSLEKRILVDFINRRYVQKHFSVKRFIFCKKIRNSLPKLLMTCHFF